MFYTNVCVTYNGTINYRGIDKNGDRVMFRDNNFKPTLYVNSGNSSVVDDKSFKTLGNQDVNPIVFNSIEDAKEHIGTYKGVDGYDLYGMTRWEYQYLNDKFKNKVNWDFSKIKTFILDIEVDSSNGFPNMETTPELVTSIAIKDLHSGEYLLWGYGDYDTDNDKITYIKVDTEEELFVSFLDFWSSNYPDIITGWNTTFFDIPYIIRRALALGLDSEIKKISPWGRYNAQKIDLHGKVENKYHIQGIDNLDYIDLYKKFTYETRASYSLDHIAKTEVGRGKTDDGTSTGFALWKTDHQKFIDYNIRDVDLISELDGKLKLLKLICTMAYSAKCNFSDVFSQVRTWDCMIYNYLSERKITIPFLKSATKEGSYAGAYVKDVVPGMYKNVVSFDIASLYPNIIRTLNIGPETYQKKVNVVNMDYILNKKPISWDGSVSSNGVVYSKEKQSLFSQLVEITYESRVEKRNEMMRLRKLDEEKHKQQIEDLDMEQYALKIQLNSLYGAIGNEYFRFYDRDNAEAITTTGQTIIQWVERSVNEVIGDYGKVFYCDTDSIFVTLEKLIDKVKPKNDIDYLDTFCKKVLEPHIQKSFDNYCSYINAYKNHLVMKREAIGDKGIWQAKKRYMLNIFDNEGVRYNEPKLKVMGVESVKSSTPQICRDALKTSIGLMMNGTESDVHDFVGKFKEEFWNSSIELASPRTANNVTSYHQKLISNNKTNVFTGEKNVDFFDFQGPIHIRGCVIFNILLKELNLTKKYETIKDGEKIKFLYLHRNPTTSKYIKGDDTPVIAFKTILPEEFGLIDYIDKGTQYNKTYVEPLSNLLKLIGWNIKPTGSLAKFL